MRNVKRIAITLLVIALVFTVVKCNVVSAYDMMNTINAQANQNVTSGGGVNVVNSTKNIAGAIITIARVICAAVAIIMLAILGMKYMTAAASDKAEIKKHAVIYVIGAVVMFACTGILTIIEQFAAGI